MGVSHTLRILASIQFTTDVGALARIPDAFQFRGSPRDVMTRVRDPGRGFTVRQYTTDP